jgi:hypothetical protein
MSNLQEWLKKHPYKGPKGKDWTPLIFFNPRMGVVDVFWTDEDATIGASPDKRYDCYTGMRTGDIVGLRLYGNFRVNQPRQTFWQRLWRLFWPE